MEDRWELSAEQTPGFGPIAERFRRAGELDRAIDLCREGLARFPNHLSGRVTLGWALLDLGRYDEARVELERVIKRAPDNLAAIRGLAELHDRAEHEAVFAPAEPATPWPPKPDVAETTNAWRDVSSSKSVDDAELSEEELPALLAELEPVEAVRDAPEDVTESPAAAVAVSDISLEPAVAEAIGEQASIDEAASGLVSLQAAMAELDASTAVVPPAATAQPVVAEFAAVETPSLDEVLSDFALAESAPAADSLISEPIVDESISAAAEPPAVALISEPASLAADAAPEPAAEEIIDLASLLPDAAADVLPMPAVDLLEDGAADVVADSPVAFEAETIVLASEPSVELAAGDAIAELFEEATLAPAPGLAAVEQPVELDAARPDLDLDLPLDPALFELARDASAEHAAPAVERAEEIFDLDTESHVEIAALEQSRDYHEPELALRSSGAGVDASDRQRALHDLSLDAPGLAPAADLPQLEFQSPVEPVEIDQVASAGTVRDGQSERAFDLSDDFASAMRGGADFASPQITQPEPVEADAAVVVAGFTPPVPDGQWSEPEQPSREVDVLEAPAAKAEPEARRKRRADKPPERPQPKPTPGDAEITVTAEPPPAPAPAPAPKRVVKPVKGLERFLDRIERRKATLASDSAA